MPPVEQSQANTARLMTLLLLKRTQDLKLQKALLESFIPRKQVSLFDEHERYLKSEIINLLEDEMDMPTRSTRRQLHDMNEGDFEDLFNRTKILHKLSWNTKRYREYIGKIDSETQ